MKKLKNWLLLNIVPLISKYVLGALHRSISFTVVDKPELPPGENAIFAYWHGRLLMMPYARRYFGREFAVMVSRHKDGELIARIVNRLGILTPRGSTSRGGAAGLRDAIRLSRKGVCVTFTPDGPKGPRYEVQPGIIQAAKATSLPIYPVTYSTRKKKLSGPGTGSSYPTRSLKACTYSVAL